MMRLAYAPYRLHFKKPAGTSRGVMTDKLTYFIKVYDEKDPSRYGIGEAAVFEGLSPEADSRFEYKLVELLANVALGRETDLSAHSSIQYGLEQALLNYSAGCGDRYFDTPFTEGKTDIVINGLVWMDNIESMISQIQSKLDSGFRCVKLKIGAIDWDSEMRMIRYMRDRFPADELELRVDANGAFDPSTALSRLEWLSSMGIHSIEQPIAKGNYEAMRDLCEKRILPIALDEELIGVSDTTEKMRMLDTIRPSYIILKPALCGGFSGASEWIRLASERGIGWWVTSALESNIGLNALAQWTATLDVSMPQGLGTGVLYTNNFNSPIYLTGERLKFNPKACIDRESLSRLDWRE